MSRVLITGATGFVGRQVAKALIEKGAEVSAIGRNNKELPQGIRDHIQVADLFSLDQDFWRETCSGFDTVVHVAWYAEPGKYVWSQKNLTCLAGTLALAQGAVHAGIKKLVGVGTCFEYDLASPDNPVSQPLSTNAPLRPATTYGAAKASTWLTLAAFLREKSVDFAWCRLFYLYGEGEDERRLVPFLKRRLAAGEPAELTSGTKVRDFMDVSEAGKRIAEVALGHYVGALNICSGEAVTVRELSEKIALECGRPDLLKFGARPDNPDDPVFVVGEPSITNNSTKE